MKVRFTSRLTGLAALAGIDTVAALFRPAALRPSVGIETAALLGGTGLAPAVSHSNEDSRRRRQILERIYIE
jgi:hypothetical protein